MKVFDAAGIRNVVLVGHSGAGKTQLASALLFDAGAVNRLGKVDDGTTVTDYDEEAIARKHTLAASLASFEWNKQKINLIDTPGMGNFLSDATRRAARRRSRRRRRRRRGGRPGVDREDLGRRRISCALPRLVVVNRLDRERASLTRTLDSLREHVRPQLRARAVAARRGKGLPPAMVDLVSMKAYTFRRR